MTRPKYLVLVDELEKIIQQTGKNEMIPSERKLAEKYGLSRMTVRKAINYLVAQNKLYRVNKVGTFATDKKIYKKANAFSGFTKEVLNAGGKPSNTLIEFSLQRASQTVAKHLNISEGDLVYKVIRLRKNNGRPIMVDEAYFPRFLVNLNEDIVQGSIYDYIQNQVGLNIVTAHQRFWATFVKPEYEKHLEITDKTPVINVQVTVFLNDGRILEWNNAYINSQHYEIVFTSYQ